MAVTQHEHIYHSAKDEPPKPEKWVLDGWAKQHASEGAGKHFKTGSPVWHELEPAADYVVESGTWESEVERGYWVITSQAEG